MADLDILVDENIPAAESCFAGIGRVRRFSGRALDASGIGDADILLVRSVTRVDRALLEGSRVRFVGTATSGIDHLDRDYLRAAGIPWAHAPGSNANSVVEYVLAAVAEAGDHLERLLDGATLGIVGYGHIGRALVARCEALGIATRVSDPWLDQDRIPGAASLQQVLQCDVISLHCELTDRAPWPSRHLLGDEELQQLQPRQLLINACRGPVVDGAALSARLEDGSGPVTVLDVWEHEPAVDPALLRQVLLGTAHIAGYSTDGKVLATRMLQRAACDALGLEPGAESDEGAPEPLRYPSQSDTAEALRALLRARYDIHADHRALCEVVLDQPTEEAVRAFDRLRRNYPVRRELAGSAVFGVRNEQQAGLCHALGCTVAGDPA